MTLYKNILMIVSCLVLISATGYYFMTKSKLLNNLSFEPKEASILHKIIPPMSFPLSKKDKKLIQKMKYAILPAQLRKSNAAWSDAVGMAANQWGKDKRIFLFAPEGIEQGVTTIINPEYIPLDKIRDEYEWEGCFSIPNTVGYIKRYSNIRVTYQNEKGEFITKNLTGYAARVWQHETDHLNGILYDDELLNICVEKKVFQTKELAEEFYDAMDREKGRV